MSLLLIGEKERDSYNKILYTLGRSDDIPTFPVNANYFQAVRSRVKLARRIDKVREKEKRNEKEREREREE